MHPRRIRDGVHQGVIDGGNQSGIPYGRGWELFDERYLGKPLVFCGTVGGAAGDGRRVPLPARRRTRIARRPHRDDGRPHRRRRNPRRDLLVGGARRVGSPVQAVQIGDPITQKMDVRLPDRGARPGAVLARSPTTARAGCRPRWARWPRRPAARGSTWRKAPLKYPGPGTVGDPDLGGAGAHDARGPAGESARRASSSSRRRREVEATVLGEFTDDGRTSTCTHGELDGLRSCSRWSSCTRATPMLDLEAAGSRRRWDGARGLPRRRRPSSTRCCPLDARAAQPVLRRDRRRDTTTTRSRG